MSIRCLFYLAAVAPTFLGATITDSIVPTMDRIERLDFDQARMATKQWEKVQRVAHVRDEKLRIVSYNMLFPLYEMKYAKKHRWAQRKERVEELVHSLAADLICPQELLQHQVEDLMESMESEYAFLGVRASDGIPYADRGRADPMRASYEMNGFFYRRDRLELLEEKVWWLSETPSIPSSTPYYSGKHTLTMGHFRDKMTGKTFRAFNTHLTFSKVKAREFETEKIVEILSEFREEPILLTGDLNAFPSRLDESFPFFDGDYLLDLLTADRLIDSRRKSLLGHVGPISSFTNDPTKQGAKPFMGTGTPGVMLDHVLVSDEFTVLLHAVEPAVVDGEYPSDHLPVIVDLTL